MKETYSHLEVKKDFETVDSILQQQKVQNIVRLIDSTLLKPQFQKQNMIELCNEAKEFHFRSVCVPPCYVSLASKILNHSDVAVCTVVGFPNGYSTIKAKCFEAKQALEEGATEIDFVQNISFVKSENFNDLEKEFVALVEVVQNKVLKVILETSLLTEDEIYRCTHLAAQCGIHIIKTSTGFGERGASLNDIATIKKALDEHVKKTNVRLGIKASGGVRNIQDALSFVQAGATRLGTSNGKIIKGM